MPAPTDDNIGDECGNIQGADDVHRRDDGQKKAGNDRDKSESTKDNDGSLELFAVQANGVEDLSDEKTNDAKLGSVVDGEDDIG